MTDRPSRTAATCLLLCLCLAIIPAVFADPGTDVDAADLAEIKALLHRADARAAKGINLGLLEQAYLKASNTQSGDQLGTRIAIDGDTVAVGAPGESSDATGVNGDQSNDDAPDSGAVYVFVRSGDTWSQQAYVKASNTGEDDSFGEAVALSGDTLIVGATWESSNGVGPGSAQDNDLAPRSGAAYVFTRSAGSWSQQAYLKASNAEGDDRFGYSVAISGDTAVVGAPREDSPSSDVGGAQGNGLNDSGAAYVFVRSEGSWTQQAYLKASNPGMSDNFGDAVAIDGDTAVVTATSEEGFEGAAYVFTRSGMAWSPQQMLKAQQPTAVDFFGWSVDISGDTIAIGSPFEDSDATGVGGDQTNGDALDAGAAYIFTRSEMTWSQQAYIKASNTEADDLFGWSIGLDGDNLVVGAPWESSAAAGIDADQGDNTATLAGAAYFYVRDGMTWSQQAYVKSSNITEFDEFGHSAAISGDTLAIGAYTESSSATGVNGPDNEDEIGSGAAYTIIFGPNLSVGGTVSGLSGGTLTIANNGVVELDITADGEFIFPVAIIDGTGYDVTIVAQPAGQLCEVTGGSGTAAGSNIRGVTVTCRSQHTVGGNTTGIVGAGLVLQLNGGDDLAIAGDGGFVFGGTLLDGDAYEVTILSEPAMQTCMVTNGAGTIPDANVTDVDVTCMTDTYGVGGNVSGVAGVGLVLQLNGGDDLAIVADGPFSFANPLTDGSGYTVTILTQPAGQTCGVANGTGTLAGADVTDVAVSCSTDLYSVGGTVTGLLDLALVLQLNDGDDLVVTADGPFQFATPLPDGSPYAVTILTGPADQQCQVSGEGTLAGADVSDVTVTCSQDPALHRPSALVPFGAGGGPGWRAGQIVALSELLVAIASPGAPEGPRVDVYDIGFLADVVGNSNLGVAEQDALVQSLVEARLNQLEASTIKLEAINNATQQLVSAAISTANVVVGFDLLPSRGGLPGLQAALYERTQAGYQQKQTLTSPAEGNDGFGASIAIDGNVVYVGAPDGNEGGTVYAFQLGQNSVVTNEAQIPNPGMPGAKFGQSLAASNGNLAVGAPGAAISGVLSGSASLYQQVGNNLAGFALAGTVTGSGAVDGGEFGTAVALEGTAMAVGAPGETGPPVLSGAAYVFDFSGATITERGRVVSPLATAGSGFGAAVALSDRGLVVGAPDALEGTGRVVRFDPTLSTFDLLEAEGVMGFGTSVAADGSLIIIGAPGSNAEAGAAFIEFEPTLILRDSFETPATNR